MQDGSPTLHDGIVIVLLATAKLPIKYPFRNINISILCFVLSSWAAKQSVNKAGLNGRRSLTKLKTIEERCISKR